MLKLKLKKTKTMIYGVTKAMGRINKIVRAVINRTTCSH